jgi:putative ABC transport system permease protein
MKHPGRSGRTRLARAQQFEEAWDLAVDAVRVHPARSVLAAGGIVIGIVTVVVVASVLVNLRNQVALLFRELGTDNIFAFHLSGDPYSAPAERERARKPLDPRFAEAIARIAPSVREVGVQMIVPTVVNGRPLIARAGGSESDTVLVEGTSANFPDVVGADLAAGRPFTLVEERAGARVAIVGANLSQALFGGRMAVGHTLTLAGERYVVVGELAPRRGGFFGENRQDNVLAIPYTAVQRRFAEADRTVLYVRARPGLREAARQETEAALRRLRGLEPGDANDFNLSTADQIIRSFDRVGAQIGLATIALAAVSLFIGGIGIANVMVIGVTERTREIGVRMALGARRHAVLQQFLLEAAILSGAGGLTGIALAVGLGLLAAWLFPGFSAMPPLWAVVAGLATSVVIGVAAGFLPARRAARLDPVDALRYE